MRKKELFWLKPMLSLLLVFLVNVAWATTITVQIRDSDGNTLPDGNTAQLKYYDGGWIDMVPNDGYGNFTVPISLLPRTVLLVYNNGGQKQLLTGTEQSPVIFNTVTFTAVVENADGDILNFPQPQWNYRMTSWAGLKDAGEWKELLPGTYIVMMKFHTGQVNKAVTIVNDNHIEVFKTTTITPKLMDKNGVEIVLQSNSPWRITHGCVGPCGGCSLGNGMELLSGSQNGFRLWYRNMLVGTIGNFPPNNVINPIYRVPNVPGDVLFFTAPSVFEVFVWNDLDENGAQSGEQNLGIQGIQVDLEKPNGDWLMSAFTNQEGYAVFVEYPWGMPLKIKVIAPNGLKFTKSKGSKTNENNSDVNKSGVSPSFQATSANEIITYIDAGLVLSGSSNKSELSIANTGESLLLLYPNPVKDQLQMQLKLKINSSVKIALYDLMGQQISLLYYGFMPSGENTFEWNFGDLPNGVYILRMQVDDKLLTEKINVLN